MDDLNALSLPALYDALNRSRLVERLIGLAYEEEFGAPGAPGPCGAGGRMTDVTGDACVGAEAKGGAAIVVRRPGVLAGMRAVPAVLARFAPGAVLTTLIDDGSPIAGRTAVGRLGGPLRSILAAERTLLNILGRLSGIATLTARYVEAVRGSGAVILDTRKTTPGLRVLEKYAVRCGGGTSHRVGLGDAILIKDNHLAGIPHGGVGAAVAGMLRSTDRSALRFIEVEADTLGQFRSLLAARREGPLRVDIVLLDNMAADDLREAVRARDAEAPGLLLEASGGVTLDSVRAIAETGVDRISVGALTHSAVALDVGLDIEPA